MHNLEFSNDSLPYLSLGFDVNDLKPLVSCKVGPVVVSLPCEP